MVGETAQMNFFSKKIMLRDALTVFDKHIRVGTTTFTNQNKAQLERFEMIDIRIKELGAKMDSILQVIERREAKIFV